MRLRHYILGGGAGGLGSGLLAVLLELSALPSLGRDSALPLAGIILSCYLGAGLLLGLLLAALLWAGRGLARLRRAPERQSFFTGLVVGLISVPGMTLLLRELARGRKAQEILGPLHVQLPLILFGALLLGGTTWLGLVLARRIGQARGRLAPLCAGTLLLGASVALFFADATLYRRLYQYLHALILVSYLVGGVLATLALGQTLRLNRRVARLLYRPAGLTAALLLALALFAGGWSARRALAEDQHLRYCAMELSVVAKKLLLFLPLPVRSEAPLFLDTSLPRQARRQASELKLAGANVVLVTIDALRADHLGAYGYGRPTSPNIDALAASAVRFESTYCQIPLTCYSIPSLHTGDYLKSTLPLLPRPPPTLARILRGRGYTTAAFYNSSLFFCDDPKATSYGDDHFGFAYAETTPRDASPLTDQVIRYLNRFQNAGKGKLFLWVHYFDVHEPYTDRPGHSFGQRSIDRYDSEIAYTDVAVGRLIAALPELSAPTILILSSDHGEEFKEHGGFNHGSTLYDEQVRIPLIIGVPGLKPRVVKAPAQQVDIVPTILALLGMRQPESVRGRSLVPDLVGQEPKSRPAYAEVATKKMVRLGPWKLIHDFRSGSEELYQLEQDPRERRNLIGQQPRVLAQLKASLNRWFDQVRAVAKAGQEDRPEAIDLGRIGDRRALPLLAQLVRDDSAEPKWRQEAARLLGQLQDNSAAEDLWRVVADDNRLVAQEAAIALGEVKDRRARLILPAVMSSTDPDLRLRAAIALARVDGAQATPALIEALFNSDWELQNRAAHYLGHVGDKRAVGPLIRAAVRLHLRSRAALALGRLGRRLEDRRILPFLLDLAQHDEHVEVRRRALTSLGLLGDRRAVAPLARLLAAEPDLIWIPDILSILDGIGAGGVPGVDLGPDRQSQPLQQGWGACGKGASSLKEGELAASWCAMRAAQATSQLALNSRPQRPTPLLLRLKPLWPKLKGQQLTITVNNHQLPAVQLRGGWQTIRLTTRPEHWQRGPNLVRLSLPLADKTALPPDGLLAVDYILLAGGPVGSTAKR